MSERAIQTEVLLAARGHGLTLWRNNVGLGWVGKVERLRDGSLLIRNPRPLHAGLCEGSSDLIGLRSVLVTPEMVGAVIAQFVAVEVKTHGKRPTPKQQHFLDFTRESGGFARVARSAGDLA